MLNAVLFEGILDGNYVGVDKSRLREERHQRYLAKPLHGQFFRSTEKGRDDKSWLWLKNGKLKKETEGLIIAAQDQALRTNSIKNRIDKQHVSRHVGYVVKEMRPLVILWRSVRCWRKSTIKAGGMIK